MNLIFFYFIVIYPTNHVYYTVIKQIPVFCLGLLHYKLKWQWILYPAPPKITLTRKTNI